MKIGAVLLGAVLGGAIAIGIIVAFDINSVLAQTLLLYVGGVICGTGALVLAEL